MSRANGGCQKNLVFYNRFVPPKIRYNQESSLTNNIYFQKIMQTDHHFPYKIIHPVLRIYYCFVGTYWHHRPDKNIISIITLDCMKCQVKTIYILIVSSLLSGNRAGQWAMTVNGPWRICFRFKNGDAHDVEITNYHKG